MIPVHTRIFNICTIFIRVPPTRTNLQITVIAGVDLSMVYLFSSLNCFEMLSTLGSSVKCLTGVTDWGGNVG